MKPIKKINLYCLLLASLAFVLAACEPDDICAEGIPPTPHLIIRFYDAANPSLPKTTSNLQIKGVGTDSLYALKSTDSIAIPLRTTQNSTDFVFTNNSQDENSANNDQVKFEYQIQEYFVSRACGYGINFKLEKVETINDVNNWIQQILIIKDTLDSETSAHVKILH